MIKKERLLYLVKHDMKPMFKIGIATDQKRFKQLDKDYDINWASSIYFGGESNHISKMEKVLHRLFENYRLEPQQGTGGTEWFSNDCLVKVIDSILFNVENSGYQIDLTYDNLFFEKDKIKAEREELDKLEKFELKLQSYEKDDDDIVGLVYDFYKWPIGKRRMFRKVINQSNILRKQLEQFTDKCIFDIGTTTRDNLFEINDLTKVNDPNVSILMYCSPEQILGLNVNREYNNNTNFVIESLLKYFDRQIVMISTNDMISLKIDPKELSDSYGYVEYEITKQDRIDYNYYDNTVPNHCFYDRRIIRRVRKQAIMLKEDIERTGAVGRNHSDLF